MSFVASDNEYIEKEQILRTERTPSRFMSFVASGDESPTHFRKIASVYLFENSSNLGATTCKHATVYGTVGHLSTPLLVLFR
jgi:hypothetical protein